MTLTTAQQLAYVKAVIDFQYKMQEVLGPENFAEVIAMKEWEKSKRRFWGRRFLACLEYLIKKHSIEHPVADLNEY